ncbi:MAG: GNAT family N-acetyltransferase [Alphaproteobacteria bacterium]|nr:GNAT family N-acetyltransferase [Alphaproteobacteria bacterium]
MDIQFRPFISSDLPVIHQFGLEHLGYDVPLAELKQRLDLVNADQDHFFRLAEDDLGTVLGMVHAYYMPLSIEPPQVVLYSLVVGPAARGKKLGSRFIALVDDFARSRNVSVMMVGTSVEREQAIQFYRSQGFEPSKQWAILKRPVRQDSP